MPELVGFQTMVILDPYGMTFDAVLVFALAFHLLFRSCLSILCHQSLCTNCNNGLSGGKKVALARHAKWKSTAEGGHKRLDPFLSIEK